MNEWEISLIFGPEQQIIYLEYGVSSSRKLS